ncbi:non-ribosomal peptide synthetase [Actinoplanes couchii]|uniref:Carrier domain-containing protein n=1 Tax=Actinoplanes couchii TaxID=403638 RepID=A0ABQ3XSL3_9ACTN|nr:non-ribosomal peptide synthetase [Actinoplanes couchii]MDR6315971.1 amino acid adenylation domain-containing protein [Actinoplanes couchii]GID61489.1 hypothetical protein Aco03nite_098930 [Actinoplanes couchii]
MTSTRSEQAGAIAGLRPGYWQEKLAGMPAAPELPADRPRAMAQSAHSSTVDTIAFTVPADVLDGLREITEAERATLFVVMLAATKVVVMRYTGQTDIVVATSAGLLLRTDCSGGPGFRELAGRVRQTVLEAFAHQGQFAAERPQAPGARIYFDTGESETAGAPVPGGCDLALRVAGQSRPDGGLDGWLSYRTDLFDESTMRRLTGHLGSVLSEVADHPDRSIAAVEMLATAERDRQLTEWNATAAWFPRDATIAGLCAAQAARTPDATAVVCGAERLSYRELDTRANRLARHLRDRGVGPESVVGVCLPPSTALVVGLLGILKAGGAYAPLDPAYPEARLRFLLADTRAVAVLTDEPTGAVLADNGIPLIRLDTDRRAIAEQDGTDLPGTAGPENLAYLIYTSGSTGTPKGVEVPHRGVVNLLWDLVSTDFPDFVLGTVPTFDIAALELFGPLVSGGTVIVSTGEYVADIAARPQRLTAQATPSKWELVLRAGSDRLRGIRCLTGGEAINESLAGRLFDAVGSFTNVYGPTETTIWSTSYTCTERPPHTVPIGRPLANTTIYVFDERMRLVPAGVTGELYIGGTGVTRGYRNRPGLTAQRFVPDPYGEPGARLYRTGDLVRYLPDGNVEFLGRRDQQVKIRGHRIEPGEIETVLSRHAAVARAVVMARESTPGDFRLVAYVVPAGVAPEPAELRAFAGEHLPAYMVPAAVVSIDEIPLLPSGKVDRSQLPEPAVTRPTPVAGARLLDEPVVRMIAAIWADLLDVEVVGPHDDFFELGGHSLLVTRVMSRIREAFGVEVPFGALFEAPTAAGLAEVVMSLAARGATEPVPPVTAGRRDGDLPLAYSQQRLWFLNQLIPDNPFYNLPVSCRIEGRLDVEALHRAVTAVVHRHEALRSTVEETSDGRAVQVVQPGGEVPMPVLDVPGDTAPARLAEAARMVERTASRVFDLAHGPVFRAALLRLSDTDHVLVLVLHHIAGDGWSMGVIARDLTRLYAAEPLPPLTVQYGDYAIWQREWLTEAVLAGQLGYWRDRLAGMPPTLELPTDRPRPVVASYRGVTRQFTVGPVVTGALRALAQAEAATLFMVLLAAFKVLLARYTGQTDIVVGAPVANRRSAELDDLVGFFVNTLVLRTDCAGTPSFRDLLGRVRDTTLGAYTHQDLPFERLVTELAPARNLSRNPLVQVVFQLQNTEAAPPRFGDAQVSRFDDGFINTRFDTEVHLQEVGGGLTGRWICAADIYHETSIDRFIASYIQLLEHISRAWSADPRF